MRGNLDLSATFVCFTRPSVSVTLLKLDTLYALLRKQNTATDHIWHSTGEPVLVTIAHPYSMITYFFGLGVFCSESEDHNRALYFGI